MKNPPSNVGRKRHRFNPRVGRIPWGRNWQPISVLWPGKFHGQRDLVGYSPRGHKELDISGQLTTPAHGFKSKNASGHFRKERWIEILGKIVKEELVKRGVHIMRVPIF